MSSANKYLYKVENLRKRTFQFLLNDCNSSYIDLSKMSKN